MKNTSVGDLIEGWVGERNIFKALVEGKLSTHHPFYIKSESLENTYSWKNDKLQDSWTFDSWLHLQQQYRPEFRTQTSNRRMSTNNGR